jgi:galactokinase
MVHHSLASSEYNVRRQQCEAGVKILQAVYPQVKSLRDATADMLEAVKDKMDELVYKRSAYVVAEIARVQQACIYLQQGNLAAFGKLMYETHDGLSRLYAVSCPELDYLVELAKQRPEVAGARVMGGGFGGCTINLVKADKVDDFSAYVRDRYQQQFNKTPEIYVTSIEDGVQVQP